MKLLGKSIEANLHDLGFGSGFLGKTPKAPPTRKTTTKTPKGKVDFKNQENLRVKTTFIKVKRQPTEWERMLANHDLLRIQYSEYIKNSYS